MLKVFDVVLVVSNTLEFVEVKEKSWNGTLKRVPSLFVIPPIENVAVFVLSRLFCFPCEDVINIDSNGFLETFPVSP